MDDLTTSAECYQMLQQEQRHVVLHIANALALDDLAVEELRDAWSRSHCRKTWDRMLCELADLLPSYEPDPDDPFTEDDRIVQGDLFIVRLPEVEDEVGVPG